MANVYLASPTYNGSLRYEASMGLHQASQKHVLTISHSVVSLVPMACNTHWCEALNGRAVPGFQWFAMLHADIDPEPWWIDKLIDLAEQRSADLMSAIVPIKSSEGLTSTALYKSGHAFGWTRGLTMAQVNHPSFPKTFGLAEAVAALAALPVQLREVDGPQDVLVVNTGCMVVRCDRPWAERVWFDDLNGIRCVSGVWKPMVTSEDYYFSHRIAQEGGKVMATTAVQVKHIGSKSFDSREVWGASRVQ